MHDRAARCCCSTALEKIICGTTDISLYYATYVKPLTQKNTQSHTAVVCPALKFGFEGYHFHYLRRRHPVKNTCWDICAGGQTHAYLIVVGVRESLDIP